MKIRRTCLLLALLLLLALGIPGCGGDATEPTAPPGTEPSVTQPATTGTDGSTTTGSEEKVFTLDELAGYDGNEGRAAYVAVDGVVYDVSASRMWPEGKHSACGAGAIAGQDLSEVLKRAPANMRALIERMPVVGELAQ